MSDRMVRMVSLLLGNEAQLGRHNGLGKVQFLLNLAQIGPFMGSLQLFDQLLQQNILGFEHTGFSGQIVLLQVSNGLLRVLDQKLGTGQQATLEISLCAWKGK